MPCLITAQATDHVQAVVKCFMCLTYTSGNTSVQQLYRGVVAVHMLAVCLAVSSGQPLWSAERFTEHRVVACIRHTSEEALGGILISSPQCHSTRAGAMLSSNDQGKEPYNASHIHASSSLRQLKTSCPGRKITQMPTEECIGINSKGAKQKLQHSLTVKPSKSKHISATVKKAQSRKTCKLMRNARMQR